MALNILNLQILQVFLFIIYLGMDIIIKTATYNHLAQILEIVNYNILNSTAVYDYEPKVLADMESWFHDKKDDNWPIIVAVTGETVVGYGTYGMFRFKEGYKYTVEHSVYASPDHIGKGIGKLLLTELIRLAKDNGYHTMIGGIDADNIGSIDFHAKFGFTKAGLLKEVGYKFDRWLDVQFMQLILK